MSRAKTRKEEKEKEELLANPPPRGDKAGQPIIATANRRVSTYPMENIV